MQDDIFKDYETEDIKLRNSDIDDFEEDMITYKEINEERERIIKNYKKENKFKNKNKNKDRIEKIGDFKENKKIGISDENITVNKEKLKNGLGKILNENSELKKRINSLIKDNSELRKLLKKYAFLQDEEHVFQLRNELEIYKTATMCLILSNVFFIIFLIILAFKQ